MIKRLTRHGNSLALVIDRPVLELLHIGEDTPLDIATDGRALTVTPVRDEKRRAEFEKTWKSVRRRYARAFKRLSK